jgi:iduronate 2-sulfatase
VGKVSHHPGGIAGVDWNDEDEIEIPLAWDKHLMPVGEWQHPRGAMHGLANGEMREKGITAVYQSADADDNQYPDGLIAQEGMRQLRDLAQKI